MDTTTFISLFETARRDRPTELSDIPFPNPLLVHHTFASTLEGLRKDWRELGAGMDPGKYKPHRFWVRGLRRSGGQVAYCDRYWPREVVDDLRAAEQSLAGPGCGSRIIVPLGALADALADVCPLCGEQGPVIGTYMQTRNSIEFDEWLFSLAVLCAPCKTARPIHRQSECRRFAHEIFARP